MKTQPKFSLRQKLFLPLVICLAALALTLAICLAFTLANRPTIDHPFHRNPASVEHIEISSYTPQLQSITVEDPQEVAKIVQLLDDFQPTRTEWVPPTGGTRCMIHLYSFDGSHESIHFYTNYLRSTEDGMVYWAKDDYFLPLFQLMDIDPEEYYQQE